MKLKTQEDIRRIEIICLMILSILKDKNIPVRIDIKVLYMIVSTIYDIDLLTVNYTQRKTEEYKELKQMYDEIINNTSSMLKELNINDPVTLFATYVYLYRSGYLSHNHSFIYSSDMKDFALLNGIDVIRGKGVCRSISSLFTDLSIKQGYTASNLLVNDRTGACGNLQKLSPIELNSDDEGKKFAEIVSKITDFIALPNHLITLVKEDNTSYIFDPTNDGYLLYNIKNKIVIPNRQELFITNSLLLKTIQKRLGMLNALSNKEIKQGFECPSVDENTYRKKYIKALELCKNNLLLFEKLYNDNCNLYKDIYTLSKEQSGLINRIIPIIPKRSKTKTCNDNKRLDKCN